MLKKFISLAVASACLVATMGVSATTVSTSTAYTGSDITVTTTVNGAGANTAVTYLAYDKGASLNDLSGDQIKFVDQKVGDVLTFTYNADSADVDANVLVGGAIGGIGGAALTTNKTNAYGVTAVTVDAAAIDFTIVDKGDELVLITGANLKNATAVEGLTNDDFFVSNEGLWIVKSALTDTIAVTTGAEVETTITAKDFGFMVDATDGDAIIAVGELKGNAEEFGIIFSADKTFANPAGYDTAAAAGTYAFPALAKGTNDLFAVKVHNFAEFVGAEVTTVYATAYTKTSGVITPAGDIFQVTIGAEDVSGSIVTE